MQIQFRDVNFRYPASNRNALSDVTFDIAPGSLVCVVGYNGAGKSTLINLLTRLADPTSGTVLISMYLKFFTKHLSQSDCLVLKTELMQSSMRPKTCMPT